MPASLDSKKRPQPDPMARAPPYPADPNNGPLATAVTVMGMGLFAAALGKFSVGRYMRCPPNRVMVVYGSGKAPSFYNGGGTYVWPVYQQHKFLDLAPMQIPINLEKTLSLRKLRVNVPSVFTVAIGTEAEMMQNAAARLLDMTRPEIQEQAADIIFGQFRNVVASMDIEQINEDREMFRQKVNENVEGELLKYGLQLINVNFKDITDEAGVIEAMGQNAASEAINRAQVEVAQKQKEGAIGVATERRERDAAVARLEKAREVEVNLESIEKEIALAEQEREKQVKVNQAKTTREVAIQKQEAARAVEFSESSALELAAVQIQQTKMKVEIAETLSTEEAQIAELDNAKVAKIEELQALRMVKIHLAQTTQETQIRRQLAEKTMKSHEIQASEEATVRQQTARYNLEMNRAKVEENKTLAEQNNEERLFVTESDLSTQRSEAKLLGERATVTADLAIQQALEEERSEIFTRIAEAKIQIADLEHKIKVEQMRDELIKAEKQASDVTPAEISKRKEIIQAETKQAKEMLEAKAEAIHIELLALAKAKGKQADLSAEAEYIKNVVEGCGGADGAVKYRLVEKMPEMAKHSADAVKGLKFDNITVWESGRDGGSSDASEHASKDGNVTSRFVRDIAGSAAPLGKLIKNVLGVDMAEYLGSYAKPHAPPSRPSPPTPPTPPVIPKPPSPANHPSA